MYPNPILTIKKDPVIGYYCRVSDSAVEAQLERFESLELLWDCGRPSQGRLALDGHTLITFDASQEDLSAALEAIEQAYVFEESEEQGPVFGQRCDALLEMGFTTTRRGGEEIDDYELLPEDISILVSMLADPSLHDASDPVVWTPVHVVRALGQLQAVDAVPVLIEELARAEQRGDDLMAGELALAFTDIGPACVPRLAGFFQFPGNGVMSRISAGEGLRNLALAHQECRDTVVPLFSAQLERATVQSPVLNAFLILSLVQLKASECLPVIRRAYDAEKVDTSICGQFREVQALFAPTQRRTAPRPSGFGHSFGSLFELMDVDDFRERRAG